MGDAGQQRSEPRRIAALFPVALAGVTIGTVELAFAASFAALVFGGALKAHLPSAVGLSLFAAMVLMIGLSLLGTAPGTVGSIQDIPAAILAVIAASIVGGLPHDAPTTFPTVVLAIGLSSLLVGAFFFVVGTLRLGRLVRFVPYPVVAGFLGGTGVLLMVGALGVLLGSDVSFADSSRLLEPAQAARWVPGAAFAVLLLVAVRRGAHGVLVPGMFLGTTALFYMVLLAAGVDMSDAEARGWLLGPFPEGGLWHPWTWAAVTQAEWSLVAGQAASMATMLVLSTVGLLLSASGTELAVRRDIDLDRDLRAAGVANMVAGLGGGMPGYHVVSLTALAHRMHAASRGVGLVAAAVIGSALFLGSDLLSLFPRPAIGGLLLFIGLALVVESVYDTRSRLSRAEYLVLALIVVVISVSGFLAGLVTGLSAAVVLFLVSYSRIEVVRHCLTGVAYRSNVDRPDSDREYLRECGDRLQIFKLQGFLFFGTANGLFERVRSRLADSDLPALQFLVLDFRRVTGLDSSAAQSFAKICALADSEHFTIVLTDVALPLQRRLTSTGLSRQQHPALRTAADVDRGVQWCEERLLEQRAATGSSPGPGEPTGWDGDGTGLDLAPLASYLDSVTVPEGQSLIRQGDRADELFFLVSGQMTALLERGGGETVRLRTVSAGSVIGELSFYLGTARTATVVADSACSLYRLPRQALGDLERQDPALAAALHRWLARVMAVRTADNLRTITALLD